MKNLNKVDMSTIVDKSFEPNKNKNLNSQQLLPLLILAWALY